MLILRLSKREDQALIPISTILKFSALVSCDRFSCWTIIGNKQTNTQTSKVKDFLIKKRGQTYNFSLTNV